MSKMFLTPRKRAQGLGSAKAGVGHFIQQRVSAVALAILAPWFLISFVVAYQSGYDGARAWVGAPMTAIFLVLLITAALYHMRLGLQVVIEDYIEGHAGRAALLILNVFAALALWSASVFAVLKIALGS